MQLITAHQVLYLEAEEQLGQRLDSLDKLQREGARESDAGSLPNALLVFTPVPGEMHKPRAYLQLQGSGRTGPRLSAWCLCLWKHNVKACSC